MAPPASNEISGGKISPLCEVRLVEYLHMIKDELI